MLQIQCLTNPAPQELDAIVAPLSEFSREQGFVWQPAPLVIALRDTAGTIIGGAIGETNWGWLYVRIVAISAEHRGTGWGRLLMLELERLAMERGCHAAWVDTFSFQSRPFYERLGYCVFGTLPDYPRGHARYFLTKSLVSGAS